MRKASTRGGIFQTPLSPSWQELHDLNQNRYWRSELRRLFAWSSAVMLEPGNLTNDHIKAFVGAIEQAGFDRPRQIIGDAVRAWNKCRESINGWPQTELVAPDTGIRKSLAFEDLPAGFQNDVEAFLAATRIMLCGGH